MNARIQKVALSLLAALATACGGGANFGSKEGKTSEKIPYKAGTQAPVQTVEENEGQSPVLDGARQDGATVVGGDEQMVVPTAPAPRTWSKEGLDGDTYVKWLAHGIYTEIAKGKLEPGDGALNALAMRTILVKLDRQLAKDTLKRYPMIISAQLDKETATRLARYIKESLETSPIIVEEGQQTRSFALANGLPDNQEDAFAKLDQALANAQADIAQTQAAANEAKELAKKAEAEKQAAIAQAQAAQAEAEKAKQQAAAAVAAQAAANADPFPGVARIPVYQGSNNVGWLATTGLGELSGFRDIHHAFTALDCQGRQGDFHQVGIGTVFRSHANGGHGLVWDLARIDEFIQRTRAEPFKVDGPAFCLSLQPKPGMVKIIKGWWSHTAGRVLMKEGAGMPTNFIPIVELGWAYP